MCCEVLAIVGTREVLWDDWLRDARRPTASRGFSSSLTSTDASLTYPLDTYHSTAT